MIAVHVFERRSNMLVKNNYPELLVILKVTFACRVFAFWTWVRKQIDINFVAMKYGYNSSAKNLKYLHFYTGFLMGEVQNAGLHPRPAESIEAPDPQDLIDLEVNFVMFSCRC